MNALRRHLSALLNVLLHARAVSPDVARTAQLMREANRLEATAPARAAALRQSARSYALA